MKKPLFPFYLLLLFSLLLVSCQSTAEEEIANVEVEAVVLPTETAVPTTIPTPVNTSTPRPTVPPPVPPTAIPTTAATSTPLPTETPLATATSTPIPAPWDILPWLWHPENAPDPLPAYLPAPALNGSGYLSNFRLIGFYGSLFSRGLGLLGNQTGRQTMDMMRGVIAEYAPHNKDGRQLIPVIHTIATIAKPCTEDNQCIHRVEDDWLWEYLAFARNNNAAIVYDIQPGRSSMYDEFMRIRPLIADGYPHAHVAIDPEFDMTAEQEPNRQVGTIDADEINAIQAELQQIAEQIGVNKVLIIHQFDHSNGAMITNKQNIINYPNVEIVINGDGYGPPGPKMRNYLKYAGEPGFEYGGFKMFTDQVDDQLIYDVPFMLPEQVMTALDPVPVYIVFQ